MAKSSQPQLEQKCPENTTEGWFSWVVATAGCCVFAIHFGQYLCGGIVYVATVNHFSDSSRGIAIWPVTASMISSFAAGPIGGVLGHKFGTRKTGMLGTFLCSVGIGLCYFSEGITSLVIFYGVLFGGGLGLIYTVVPVITSQYFCRRKSLGVGIVYCGTRLGGFIIPFIVQASLDAYGYRGMFLVLSGLQMNALVVVSLMRPRKLENVSSSQFKETSVRKRSSQETSSCSLSKSSSKKGGRSLKNNRKNRRGHKESHPKNTAEEHSDHLSGLLRTTDSVGKNDVEVCTPTDQNLTRTTWKALVWILTFPVFYVMAVCHGVFYGNSVVYATVIVDYGVDNGTELSIAKYLITAEAFGFLLGRVSLGWITDNNFISRKKYLAFSFFILAGLHCCHPVTNNFPGLVILSALCGMFQGGLVPMFPLIMAEYIGQNTHALSFGMMMFLSAFPSLATPALVGHFRDGYGSYDGIFYTMAGLGAVCGMLLILEDCWSDKRGQMMVVRR